MKDIYVLHDISTGLLKAAADDFDRVSMESAKYSAEEQKTLRIDNIDLLEEGD